ncbi:MAG: ABC transporter permease [Gammaproteobacteria bacterium]|nr:ABC transporter permease [Gammaproteobacteria bacterium]
MMRRIAALFHARNLEFIRDRASLSWNLLFPALLVLGLAFVFSGDDKSLFKVAQLTTTEQINPQQHPFLSTEHIQFFTLEDRAAALKKVATHQIDLLLEIHDKQVHYWVNSESANGYIVEKLLLASDPAAFKQTTQGQAMRYVDWLLPGILSMNIMFSCLFGVGFIVVRYRKNGYLKRLNATPVAAIEFLIAQILSRLLLLLSVTVLVYMGTDYFLDFSMHGSYWHLLLLTALGIFCMISLALTLASRTASEELAGGLLNVISWPMMLLSGVWFSLEGSPEAIQMLAHFFPLTHLINGARAIMLEGADLSDIRYSLLALSGMSLFFLLVSAKLFRWKAE